MVKTQINKTDLYYEIAVDGEIDASSSIQLDNELENAFKSEEKKILLDMTHLQYISSAGLGVFIARLEEMKEKEISLVFFGLNENVKQVFSLLGLEELLTIVPDKEQAIVALG
jgi:anti-sigma B factor antagonist